MKNYLQDGNVVTLTAPRDVDIGEGYFIGQLFCVAVDEADSGESFPACVSGVVELDKDRSAFVEGQLVYFDGTDITDDNTYGCVGFCVEDAASGDATVKFLIHQGWAGDRYGY